MEKVSIVESTTAGNSCGTNRKAVWGADTDGAGWPLAGTGGGVITERLKAGPLQGAVTCLRVNSGGNPVNYVITYVQE